MTSGDFFVSTFEKDGGTNETFLLHKRLSPVLFSIQVIRINSALDSVKIFSSCLCRHFYLWLMNWWHKIM